MPTVEAVRMSPVSIAAVAADRLQEDRDHEEAALQDEPLHVLGHQPQIRRSIAEQSGGQQRFFTASLLCPNVSEEPDQEDCPDPDQRPHRGDAAFADQDRVADHEVLLCSHPAIVSGLQDAQHHEDQTDGRQNGPHDIEPCLRALRTRELPTHEEDRQHHKDLGNERSPPADGARDETANQRAGRGPKSGRGAHQAERLGARFKVGERDREDDVDRWNHERRPDPLQQGIADDQHSETLRERGQQGASPINHQTQHEAALAAEDVCELAPGNHQRGHRQGKKGDRRLNAVRGRAQILRDAGDRHVHIGAGVAGDELGQDQREDKRGNDRGGGASASEGFAAFGC